MGKTRLIPVVVQEHTRTGWNHFGEWKNSQSGKPTNENLATYRKVFVDSTKPGGCNDHLGPTNTGNLRIVDQRNGGKVLATYTAPLFEVV